MATFPEDFLSSLVAPARSTQTTTGLSGNRPDIAVPKSELDFDLFGFTHVFETNRENRVFGLQTRLMWISLRQNVSLLLSVLYLNILKLLEKKLIWFDLVDQNQHLL